MGRPATYLGGGCETARGLYDGRGRTVLDGLTRDQREQPALDTTATAIPEEEDDDDDDSAIRQEARGNSYDNALAR